MEPIEYICTFSTLGQLQAAHQYRYRLSSSAAGFLVQLESRGLPGSGRDCFTADCSAAEAKALLRLLYENVVPPESGPALARDMLSVPLQNVGGF